MIQGGGSNSEMSGDDHETVLRKLGSRTSGAAKMLKTTEAAVEADKRNEEIRLNNDIGSQDRPVAKQRSIPAFLRGPAPAIIT